MYSEKKRGSRLLATFGKFSPSRKRSSSSKRSYRDKYSKSGVEYLTFEDILGTDEQHQRGFRAEILEQEAKAAVREGERKVVHIAPLQLV
ncbi:MAG: hypothetical protein CMF50_02515 [Legionellales bacterium]|nr:hypothetical protein [Legionellales bacterium]|tara:strand:- start:30771 stop:31040 length:270 start_codon:yes stop_codon:yes gene_type:complete